MVKREPPSCSTPKLVAVVGMRFRGRTFADSACACGTVDYILVCAVLEEAPLGRARQVQPAHSCIVISVPAAAAAVTSSPAKKQAKDVLPSGSACAAFPRAPTTMPVFWEGVFSRRQHLLSTDLVNGKMACSLASTRGAHLDGVCCPSHRPADTMREKMRLHKNRKGWRQNESVAGTPLTQHAAMRHGIAYKSQHIRQGYAR
jgi:hypothetical protein